MLPSLSCQIGASRRSYGRQQGVICWRACWGNATSNIAANIQNSCAQEVQS